MALNQLVALDNGGSANAFQTGMQSSLNMLRSQQNQALTNLEIQKAAREQDNRDRLIEDTPAAMDSSNPQAQAKAQARIASYAPDHFNQIQTGIGAMQANQRAMLSQKVGAISNAALYADTPEKWDAGIDQLTKIGYIDQATAAQYKGRFDLRASIIAQNADLMKRVTFGQDSMPQLPGSQPQGGAMPAAAPGGMGGAIGATPPAVSSGPLQDGPSPTYTAHLIGAESGGDPNAKNPNSSASGLGQFTDGTWLGTLRKNMPAAKDMSDDDLLGMKSDPALQKQALGWLTNDNAAALKGKGIPVNDTNLYLAHWAGADGAAKLLQADPSTPVSKLLSKDAIAANANMKFNGKFLPMMTAGDLQQWAAAKMGVNPDASPTQPKGIQTADLSGTTGFQAAANQQPPQGQQRVAQLPAGAILVQGEHGLVPEPGAPEGFAWVRTPQGRGLARIDGLATLQGQQHGETAAAAAPGQAQATTIQENAKQGQAPYISQQEQELSSNFRSQRVVQERMEAGTNYRAAQDLAKQRTPAADQVLAETVAKVIDPSAGPNLNAASIMQLQGVGAKVGGILSKALGGSGIGDAERNELLQAIQSKMASLDGGYQQEVKHFTGVAQRRGLNVANIIPDLPVLQDGQQVQYPVPKPVPDKGGKGDKGDKGGVTTQPPPPAVTPAPPPEMPSGLPGTNDAETPQPQPKSKFADYSAADLGKVDKTKLDPASRTDYENEVLKRRAAMVPPDAVEAELRRRGAIK